MEIHNSHAEPWKITLVDTGVNSMTGGRLKRAAKYLNNEPFLMTYGDGVGNVDIKAFTASYYNSLSFAFAEIVGRSYGGGVLELMPSEVEKILLPYNEAHSALLPEIDRMIREKVDIDTILEYTDNIILKDTYNFTDN